MHRNTTPMSKIDEYRLAFSMLAPMNIKIAQAILQRVGSEREFFELPTQQLRAVVGSRSRLNDEDRRAAALEKARRELPFIDSTTVKPVYFTDDEYPERLINCDDAPTLLYMIGDCRLNGIPAVSIVGTRHATPYGISCAEKIVERLAERVGNIVIVSGLAYGIDVAAHRAALRCGLPTVAVMAQPLNTIYPAEHRDVAARIVKSGGALISEYSTVDPVHKGNFLARNRIVAGLSDITIVVESDLRGGAMSTARIASAYNRGVCAVPGRTVDQYSRGCNHLIAMSLARLILSADDVIDEAGWPTRPVEGEQQQIKMILRDEQKHILELLNTNPEFTVNDMAVRLGMRFNELTDLLVEMEMDGLVTAIPGGRYAVLPT